MGGYAFWHTDKQAYLSTLCGAVQDLAQFCKGDVSALGQVSDMALSCLLRQLPGLCCPEGGSWKAMKPMTTVWLK